MCCPGLTSGLAVARRHGATFLARVRRREVDSVCGRPLWIDEGGVNSAGVGMRRGIARPGSKPALEAIVEAAHPGDGERVAWAVREQRHPVRARPHGAGTSQSDRTARVTPLESGKTRSGNCPAGARSARISPASLSGKVEPGAGRRNEESTASASTRWGAWSR